MITLEERIARTKEKVRQLESQNKVNGKNDASAASFDADTRRQIILGGIATEYFSWLLKLQPQATEMENEVEFAPWTRFLSLLVSDTEYVNRLIDKVYETLPEINSGNV